MKCGDSLVGLGKAQILGFHWKPERQRDFARAAIEGQLGRALDQRRQIREAPDSTSEALLRERLTAADGFLDPGRRYGDLVISAFFAADNDRRRKERLESLSDDLAAQRSQFDVSRHQRLDAAVGGLRGGPHPVVPFHWEIEFPEVFDRANGGFDAFVGNPPFAGKNTMAAGDTAGYPDWLKEIHGESHGNSDLVAHFFRRAFNLIRQGGGFGLIATNTIGQGDTRSTGLRWICNHGGVIYAATRRKKWPGQAAVSVSVVHVGRKEVTGRVGGVGQRPAQPTEGRDRVSNATPVLVGSAASQTPLHPPYELDGRPVPMITAYLFHAGGHDDPERLRANAGKSFVGSYVLGMGFTFDDTDTKGVASSIAEMHRLIDKDPRNAERIFPYIGGEEVNDSPTHTHHRYVINFGEMGENEARKWPDLMRIVEERVKPGRLLQNREIRARYWWRFGETTPALFDAIRGMMRVLAISRVGQQGAFTFLPGGTVYAETIVVFPLQTCAAFCPAIPTP